MFLWHSKKYSVGTISKERRKKLKQHTQRFGIPISNFELWDLALTHISCVDVASCFSYERLEFLGDSVLGLCIADVLFKDYFELSEGKMSMLKSSLVNEKTLARLARNLNLLLVIKLGKGERLIDDRAQDKVLCDIFESTVAVIFLQYGIKKTRYFIKKLLDPEISLILKEGNGDFKTKLQKISIRVFREYPVYEIADTEGPEHGKIFTIKGITPSFEASAKGRSKKEAEQIAARLILDQMEEHALINPDSLIAKELADDNYKG